MTAQLPTVLTLPPLLPLHNFVSF